MGPTDESRVLVLGRTGSGKTWFSIWLLASRNYDEIPWIIVDYKRDSLVSVLLKLKIAKVLKIGDKPPTKPGIYVYRPILRADDDEVEAFLMECYKKGEIGLYFDEGYSVPQRVALDAILTQGRSKHIPVIILYQRPVWLTKFGKSQADYVATFHLNFKQDRLAVLEFTGETLYNGKIVNANTRLPKHHCLWYDVSDDLTTILRPVPGKNEIINLFRTKQGITSKRSII